jgi:hypothetical protein
VLDDGDVKVMVVELTIRPVLAVPAWVVSAAQDEVSPPKTVTVYGGIPPDHVIVAVTVVVWPESTADGAREDSAAERAGSIVNGEVDDSIVTST